MKMNFEFPEDRIKELKELQKETGVENMKDLINNALSLLEWVTRETKNGNEIATVNEANHNYRVLVMPKSQKLRNFS